VISDINNVEFGAHLTQAQLQEYQKPDDASSSMVLEWLRQAGIEEARLESSWIRFHATIGSINSLLGCKLSEYETPRNARLYRTTEYSLPDDLIKHVQLVYPVTQFVETKTRRLLKE
jgi:tripeptidyl-peptidase-1